MNIKKLPLDPKDPGFNPLLKSLLELHRISIADLAKFTNVSYKTAHNWVHGRHAPPRRGEILTQEDVIEIIRDTYETAALVKEAQIAGDAEVPQKSAANGFRARKLSPEEIALDAKRRAEGAASVAAWEAEKAEKAKRNTVPVEQWAETVLKDPKDMGYEEFARLTGGPSAAQQDGEEAQGFE